MNKKRIVYIGILLIVTVIVTITSFSYAFLTRVDEEHGKLNIVVGDLTYKIESNDLTNNSITLSAGEGKEIELTIKAENEIDTKYELYTNSVENVEIGYLAEEGFNESTGTISKNGTKKIKVVLENTSDTSKTITFGVQGGFDYNNITLSSGRVAVEEGEQICNIMPGTSYEFDYTGSVQEFTTRCSGLYKIELWGASGGQSVCDATLCTIGANGGFVSGNITLNANKRLYLYVGAKGQDGRENENASGGYNGGGLGTSDESTGSGYEASGAGGGATDIRYFNNTPSSSDLIVDSALGLNSRIMVAGAGGGSSYKYAGGAAGGLNGYSNYNVSSGGTQTSGYQFGKGENASGIADSDGVGGGAGGYYGGTTSNTSYKSAGAGGSSYISGYLGSLAIDEDSTTEPRALKSGCVSSSRSVECSTHYSGLYFTDGVMIDGKGCNWSTGSAANCGANQPQPNGTTATGHSGNGYARITYLGPANVTFNAKGGTTSEPTRQVIYGKEIGTLPTPTYTGKYFLGWYLEESYTTKVEENYIVTDNITLYAKWEDIVVLENMLNTKPTATTENTTYNYNSDKLNITFNPTDTANMGARVIFNNKYNTAGVVHIKGTMTVQNSSATIKSKISMALGSTERGSEKGTVIIKDNIDRGSTVSFDETFEIPVNTYMTIQIGRHNTTDYSGSLIGTAEITEFYITNH